MAIINLGRVVGRGITKIEKTSTVGLVDTYTITYSDNTTSTYTVTNGANGTGSSTPATGNGLTAEQITALDEMFKRCVFTEDISTVYANFKTAFGLTESGGDTPSEPEQPTVTTYTITRSLTNCTSNKAVTSVNENTSYSETFTASSGYTLIGASVSVTMGGVDISSSYSNGVLTISKVTGNIIINVSAVQEAGSEEPEIPVDPTEPVYALVEPTELDGTSGIDTGYKLNDTDKDFSMVIEFNKETGQSSDLFDASKNGNLYGPRYIMSPEEFHVGSTKVSTPYGSLGITRLVITHTKDSGIFNIYYKTGTMTFTKEYSAKYSAYATNQHATSNTGTLKIGSAYTGTSKFFTDTINKFEVYERVISNEEIQTFLAPTWEEPSETINLINKETLNNSNITMADGRTFGTGYYETDFISVTNGKPYISNISKYIDGTTTSTPYIYYYDAGGTYLSCAQISNSAQNKTIDMTKTLIHNSKIAKVKLVFHNTQLDTILFAEGKV